MAIKVEDAIANLKYQILRFEKGTEPDLALQMAIKALQEQKVVREETHKEILKEMNESAEMMELCEEGEEG